MNNNDNARYRAWLKQADTLGRAEIEALLPELEQCGDRLTLQGLRPLLERWAAIDPERVLAYCDSRPLFGLKASESLKSDTVKTALNTLAKRDPAAAFDRWLDYSERNPDLDRWSPRIAGALFSTWSRADRAGALRAITTLENESDRECGLSGFIAATEADTPEGPIPEDILDIGDEFLRLHGIRRFARLKAAKTDLHSMGAWIDELDLTASDTAVTERESVEHALQQNPEAAADWLLARATDDSYPDHMARVMQWAHREPNACGEWLRGHELGPRTDRAVAAFADIVHRDDMGSAFAWADKITDDRIRYRTLERLTNYASRSDPGAALAALAEARVEESQLAKLLKILQ